MATHSITDSARFNLNSTDDIVAAIRAGEMVVILDDEERENEGDLVMAATKVTPAAVNTRCALSQPTPCIAV